jgi:hypothetical protein
MVLWNLLDDGASHSGALLESFKSMRGGTQVPILINGPRVLGK